jgi:adenylate kinase family enzyme
VARAARRLQASGRMPGTLRRVPVCAALLLALFASSTAIAQRRAPAKKVIVFVGMPGAGKSTAASRLATRLGTSKLSTGDIIRNAIAARGLEYNAVNDRAVAEEFARKPGTIGRQSAALVARDPARVSIVEGFRSEADLDAFLKVFPGATVVAVEVGSERRYRRMLARGRSGEDNVAYLRDRDRAEIRRGVRKVMRRANVRIRPRGDSFESLDRSLDRVFRVTGL